MSMMLIQKDAFCEQYNRCQYILKQTLTKTITKQMKTYLRVESFGYSDKELPMNC